MRRGCVKWVFKCKGKTKAIVKGGGEGRRGEGEGETSKKSEVDRCFYTREEQNPGYTGRRRQEASIWCPSRRWSYPGKSGHNLSGRHTRAIFAFDRIRSNRSELAQPPDHGLVASYTRALSPPMAAAVLSLSSFWFHCLGSSTPRGVMATKVCAASKADSTRVPLPHRTVPFAVTQLVSLWRYRQRAMRIVRGSFDARVPSASNDPLHER
ncbi:hypothetical protein BDV93DRAFT_513020 [Ceratobasidium sp. AG-I]|nr:hypothetical protein BDV93DRAFT_513020 [Ceratobasidium sp. AG-I]